MECYNISVTQHLFLFYFIEENHNRISMLEHVLYDESMWTTLMK